MLDTFSFFLFRVFNFLFLQNTKAKSPILRRDLHLSTKNKSIFHSQTSCCILVQKSKSSLRIMPSALLHIKPYTESQNQVSLLSETGVFVVRRARFLLGQNPKLRNLKTNSPGFSCFYTSCIFLYKILNINRNQGYPFLLLYPTCFLIRNRLPIFVFARDVFFNTKPYTSIKTKATDFGFCTRRVFSYKTLCINRNQGYRFLLFLYAIYFLIQN